MVEGGAVEIEGWRRKLLKGQMELYATQVIAYHAKDGPDVAWLVGDAEVKWEEKLQDVVVVRVVVE